jgi:hypothetical protein
MAFDREQQTIARSALLAVLVTVAMLVIAGQYAWREADALPARLALAATAFAPLALSLFLDIALVTRHRFAEPLDRDAAAANTHTTKAVRLNAILRNTHEQVTLAAFIYIIAALMLPRHWTDAILGCSALFLIARLVFANGYAKGAGGRAFGFTLTFYPGVMLAILTAITALL